MEDRNLSFNFLSFHPLKDKIMVIDENNIRVPIEVANSLFGSKKQIYSSLLNLGLYLPKDESKGCTVDYLLAVARKEVFYILCNDVKPAIMIKKKLTKIDLITYLEEKYITNVALGFTALKLPNREWLESLLHTFEPSHHIFTGIESSNITVDIPMM